MGKNAMGRNQNRHTDKTVGDRVRCVVASCGSDADLEKRTNIPGTTWHNVRYDKQRVNEDHLEAIREVAPEYSYWIMTGTTSPALGQIAPERCRVDKE